MIGERNGEKASLLWNLLISFSKISPVTFGGGYAMIPVIEKEIVETRAWMDSEEMNDVLSIASSAPGGIGVNTATLIGFRLAGLPGAIAAVLGISLPTFVIMLLLTIGYSVVQDNRKITAAFEGIHAAVVAFIAVSGWRMWKSAVYDKTTMLIVLGGLAGLLFTGLHPALLLLMGTAAGYAVYKWKEKWGVFLSRETSAKTKTRASAVVDPGQYIWGDGI